MVNLHAHRGRLRLGIYLLPNLFTTLNLLCGFYAVIAALEREFVTAATAIIVAAVFDSLDGKIARLTHTTSQFGVEYDSLADVVSFGMAPALLMVLWCLQPLGRLGWLSAFFIYGLRRPSAGPVQRAVRIFRRRSFYRLAYTRCCRYRCGNRVVLPPCEAGWCDSSDCFCDHDASAGLSHGQHG
jgi:uncharacterized protein YunC (DUF1805 family)